MGAERLRQMNQSWGSVNTLTKSSNKRQSSDSASTSDQALAKRQRRASRLKETLPPESAYQKSPSNSRPTSNSRQHGDGSVLAPAPDLKHDTSADVYDHEPAPANVTSDISSRRGRPRGQLQSAYSPALSRLTTTNASVLTEHDEIETSEDELQANHPSTASSIRRRNFSQIRISPRSRPRMRGDILPTRFADSAPRKATHPSMAILKAVSGDLMYDLEEDGQHLLSLQQSPSKPSYLEASSNGQPDQDYQWISFDVQDAKNIRYGGCFLSLRRSMVRGRPPTILLQFASPEDASQVARMLSANIAENRTREEMKKMLDFNWEKAVKRSNHLGHNTDIQRVYRAGDGDKSYSKIEQHTKSLEDESKKFRERMTARSDHEKPRRSASPVRRVGMQTRGTRRLSPTRKESPPIPERWSDKNVGWEEHWKQTLVYPATGRNRASVDKEDILRLDEGEFLNDNLISFYLRYLQTNMEREQPEVLNRVHIFSTFFFEKLTSRKSSINYDGVRSWTSKLDLFSYDYIVVPVNENAHWYLAVICNTPKLLEPADDDQSHTHAATDALGRPQPETPIMATVEREMSDISLEDVTGTRRSSRQLSSGVASSPSKVAAGTGTPAKTAQGPRAPSKRLDASQPRIVTLDSLGSNHSATCKALKEYLVEEAKDKKNIELVSVPGGMKARGIPEQNNFCDCGVFVLGYMEEFLKDPDGIVRKILMRENIDWSIDAAGLRKKVRNLLFRLQKEQTERMAKEREERRHKKRLSKSSGSVSAVIRDVSPRSVVNNRKDGFSTPQPPQKQQPMPSPAARESVTPIVAASNSPGGVAAEASADEDEGSVDIVKTPSEVNRATETKSPVDQPPRASLEPQGLRSLPDSPPASSTLAESYVNDTQDSVQLLSVITKPQTPQTSQAHGV
ncbi:hypothetical protein PWT90_04394 [Aphanocladium album]|nr:hypothetical protein PWT90_04394 [Aphanocladium album]